MITPLYPDPTFTSFTDMFTYAGTVTNGLFGTTVIGTIFILLLMATKNYGTEKAVMFSGGMSTILAAIGAGFGLVPPEVLAPLVILTVVGVILDWRNGQ